MPSKVIVIHLLRTCYIVIKTITVAFCTRELLREKWLREERLQYRYLELFSYWENTIVHKTLGFDKREIELLPINFTVNNMKIHIRVRFEQTTFVNFHLLPRLLSTLTSTSYLFTRKSKKEKIWHVRIKLNWM